LQPQGSYLRMLSSNYLRFMPDALNVFDASFRSFEQRVLPGPAAGDSPDRDEEPERQRRGGEEGRGPRRGRPRYAMSLPVPAIGIDSMCKQNLRVASDFRVHGRPDGAAPPQAGGCRRRRAVRGSRPQRSTTAKAANGTNSPKKPWPAKRGSPFSQQRGQPPFLGRGQPAGTRVVRRGGTCQSSMGGGRGGFRLKNGSP
jgi:hypothetical protein